MSFQGRVLVGQAVVFAVAGAIYFAGGGSLAGMVLLVAAAIFGVWTAIFLLRRSHISEEAEMAPSGVFPTATTRGPLLALAVVLLANGLIVGWWLAIVGLGVLMVAAVSYAREYRGSDEEE